MEGSQIVRSRVRLRQFIRETIKKDLDNELDRDIYDKSIMCHLIHVSNPP